MLSILWQILYYSWITSEIVIAVKTRTRREGGNVQDRGSMLILWLVLVASITACEWTSATHLPNMFGGAGRLKIVAVATLASALAIRWTAVLFLGKAFSANVAIRESQRLNTSGLYGIVRHPSYLGLLLVFVAIGIHSLYWLSFTFATVPTTAALLYRIRIEEEALRTAFGDEYRQYIQRTKRLIPGVF